ncbi:MAG: sporulation integral membrane protein YtvI [Peptococcaceae bacterium]
MNNKFAKQLTNLISAATAVIILLGVYLLLEYIFPFFKVSLNVLLGAFSPFILALIFAVLIDPLVNLLEDKIKVSRSSAVLFSLLLILTVLGIFIILISSRMIIELVQLSGKLPVVNQYISEEGFRLLREIRIFISNNPLPAEVQHSLQNNTTELIDSFKLFLGKATQILVNFLTTLPLIFTIVIVSAIATFFISKDKELIINFFMQMIPVRVLLPLQRVINTMTGALFGFLRAQIFLITMTAVQAMIGLYIIGSDFVITMGVLTGLVDLIPILGPGSIFIPWSLWHIFVGNYKFGVALLILYGILITVRQLLEPKILGDSIGLHPLATLMSIFVGLRLLGIKGIIIGPIVLLIIKVILEVNKSKRSI